MWEDAFFNFFRGSTSRRVLYNLWRKSRVSLLFSRTILIHGLIALRLGKDQQISSESSSAHWSPTPERRTASSHVTKRYNRALHTPSPSQRRRHCHSYIEHGALVASGVAQPLPRAARNRHKRPPHLSRKDIAAERRHSLWVAHISPRRPGCRFIHTKSRHVEWA